jgi:hypothetical protein
MYLAPKNTAKIDIYKIYPRPWGPTDIFLFLFTQICCASAGLCILKRRRRNLQKNINSTFPYVLSEKKFWTNNCLLVAGRFKSFK